MSIEVELFGNLLAGAPRCQILTLEQPLTVLEIAIRLGLDPDEIGLIAINGVQSEMQDLLTPGCRLCFFPPMSGG